MMKRNNLYRSGFTLLELLVVSGILGVLVMLLLPAVQAAREAARRMSCSNNIRQVGLGVAQYHDAFNHLPPHGTGTFNNANDPFTTNQFRLSFLVSITPFIDARPMWSQISGKSKGDVPQDVRESETVDMMSMDEYAVLPKHDYPPMGPVPSMQSYPPWMHEIGTFRCPSDPGVGLPAMGRTNYTACMGDSIEGLDEGMWRYESKKWVPSGEDLMRVTGRGMFVPRMVTTFDDVTDGLANTILLGEIATDLGDQDIRTAPSINNGWSPGVLDDVSFCKNQIDARRPRFWNLTGFNGTSATVPNGRTEGRGFRWADFSPLMTGCNTTLPPNSELCFGGDEISIGTLTMSSRHQGGGHVVMGDGATKFMTDSIDGGPTYGPDGKSAGTVVQNGTGPFAPDSPSPFGLWGALGTRAQNELVSDL